MPFNCYVILFCFLCTHIGGCMYLGGGGGSGVKISIKVLLYEIANFQIDRLCVPYNMKL